MHPLVHWGNICNLFRVVPESLPWLCTTGQNVLLLKGAWKQMAVLAGSYANGPAKASQGQGHGPAMCNNYRDADHMGTILCTSLPPSQGPSWLCHHPGDSNLRSSSSLQGVGESGKLRLIHFERLLEGWWCDHGPCFRDKEPACEDSMWLPRSPALQQQS